MTLPALLTGSSAADQVHKLREVCAWVSGADAGQAADALERAAQVRAYVKAIKGSAEIAAEATRVECYALRRLALLGVPEAAGNSKTKAARRFGAMSDAEFAEAMEHVASYSGALGIHRALLKAETRNQHADTGREVGSGSIDQPLPTSPADMVDLVRAAGALLHQFAPQGRPFSLAEVAEELATEFGGVGLDGVEAAAREGYIEVVRLAIKADEAAPSPSSNDDAPAWVTYKEDVVGWVRIPWSTASIDQFRAMVELRRSQLDQLQAVVGRLEGVLEVVELNHSIHPGLTRCEDLLNVMEEVA